MHTPSEAFKKILTSKETVRIKLLGDSITHGLGGVGFEQDGEPLIYGCARNPNGYCWANLFTKHMKEKYSAEVVNNSMCGIVIQDIINNFDALVDPEDDIIICSIGTNNRNYYGDKALVPTREDFGTDFYNYTIKLNSMIKDAGKEAIFISNVPACPSREEDGPTWIMLLHMDDINLIHKRASENQGFPLINLYESFLEYCEKTDTKLESLYWDGLHPNDRGFELMFNMITKELDV